MAATSGAAHRVAVVAAVVVLALGVFLAGAVVAQADDDGASAAAIEYAEHRVRSGDTLWDIASEYVAPGDDVRVLIEEIKRGNGLTTSVIVPGQVLLVPIDR